MIHIDFSIFYADDSYGHANGEIDAPASVGKGSHIDLAGLSPFPAPLFFPAQLLVESVHRVEDDRYSYMYMCADVWVSSREEVLLLSRWLESVPGLRVWPHHR
jgi:hypothetical protein